jgi:glutamate synthase domain-containing protein 1
VRIVAMLTRMIERGTQVREGEAVYGYVNENGNVGKSGQPEGAGDSQ